MLIYYWFVYFSVAFLSLLPLIGVKNKMGRVKKRLALAYCVWIINLLATAFIVMVTCKWRVEPIWLWFPPGERVHLAATGTGCGFLCWFCISYRTPR